MSVQSSFRSRLFAASAAVVGSIGAAVVFATDVAADGVVGAAASTAGATAGAAANAPSPFASLIPFALIFVVFYFLLIRPQKKKAQQEQAMLSALNKGDEIYTRSGIVGTISGLTDKIVTLEVDQGVKIKVLRGQVGGQFNKLFENGNSQSKELTK